MSSTNTQFLDVVQTSVVSVSALDDKNHRSRDYSRIFAGLLFALFIVTLLFAIVAGTKVYSALATMHDISNESRLAVNLLENSIRAADAVGAVGEGSGPEGPALVLTERFTTGEFETRIYSYEGNIVQEYALADAPYDPAKATGIVASETFAFTFDEGVVSVETDDGTAVVALRTEAGGEAHAS